MKLTKKWLKEHNACEDGYEYALENLLGLGIKETVEKLMSDNKFDWANWYLTKFFNKKQSVEYAIFAAESVLGIYEKQYPKDDRPRKAIEAAKECLKNPSDAAYAAAYAVAYAAARTADAAAELKTKIINYGLDLINGK